MWAKGSGELSTMWHLLCDLQWQGRTTAIISDTRGGHGPPTLGVCEQAPPAAPVTSEFGKKWALQPSTTGCCSHSSGNTSALLLPLPNVLGTTYTCLITVTSQDPATRSSLHSISCMAKWDEVFLAWPTGGGGKPP